MAVPPNHPKFNGTFSNINHPAPPVLGDFHTLYPDLTNRIDQPPAIGAGDGFPRSARGQRLRKVQLQAHQGHHSPFPIG